MQFTKSSSRYALVGLCVLAVIVLARQKGESYTPPRCLPGQFGPPGKCQACPAGTRSWGAGAASCQKCPPGTYQASRGQKTCLQCPPGTRAWGEGATSCQKCPAGNYQPAAGQKTCLQCPPGTRAWGEGAAGCQKCPPGTTSGGAWRECRPCKVGFVVSPDGKTCVRRKLRRFDGSGGDSPSAWSPAFDANQALATVNALRSARYGLPAMTLDADLSTRAQAKATLVASMQKGLDGGNAHNFGKGDPAFDFGMNGACENLSIECDGPPDSALQWALSKWIQFEDPDPTKRLPEGTSAAGSPCSVSGIDSVTFGHHKALMNLAVAGVAPICRGNTVGFGLAPYSDPGNPSWKWIVSSWTR